MAQRNSNDNFPMKPGLLSRAYSQAKEILGGAIVLIAIFYVVMFFFAGDIELPYRYLPDFIKLDRMIAAETIQCGLESGQISGFARLGIGITGEKTAILLARVTTRSQIIEIRDAICSDNVKGYGIRHAPFGI